MTYSLATAPTAPGLFSMTTGWPHASLSFGAISRATMSTPPPGAKGTMTCTGRTGKSCACTCAAASAPKSPKANAALGQNRLPMAMPFSFCFGPSAARTPTNSRSLARRPCPRRKELGRLHRGATPPIFQSPFQSSLMTLSASPKRRAERRGDLPMATAPLMPKATAVWLVENTSLSFDQIAQLCNLHPLEVKAIADGDAAQGIEGLDPILTGQLTRDEITAAEADPNHKLHIAEPKVRLPEAKPKKGPRYTPGSRRQDRPNAILWLVRNHPELKDSQIMRLVGTTKSTISAIRDRTHWNSANLTPLDPVTLGLCSQIDLDLEVQKAAKEKPVPVEAQGATLLPASVTTAPKEEPEAPAVPTKKSEDDLNVEAVFAKLKQLGGKSE